MARLLAEAGIPTTESLIESLAAAVRRLCPKDPGRADILADAAIVFAHEVASPKASAFANRAKGDVLFTMKRTEESLPYYERAIGAFRTLELPGEFGRTLCAQMENLTYLGRYEEALILGSEARTALTSGDPSYLPTLDIAFGNLYYRLSRYFESLAHYERAQLALSDSGDHVRLAAIGLNRAHVLNELNRFDEAYQSFLRTRQFCEEQGLHLWAAITDRGVSQMEFLRGNYSAALRTLERVRERHQALGDERRVGLCDLDRAEIYLQLNLLEETIRLADTALLVFENLHHRSEAARCLTFRGIAQSRLHMHDAAERSFLEARAAFTAEGNRMWVSVVDVCLAQLMFQQGHFPAARSLAVAAAQALENLDLRKRAAFARLIAAQCSQELGETAQAVTEAESARDLLSGLHAPWAAYQIYNTLGRLKDQVGDVWEAEDLYIRAVTALESMRGAIRLDELRMSFGKDKNQTYENIVGLKLRQGRGADAFELVERSKSRTLMDLLSHSLDSVFESGNQSFQKLDKVRQIRGELNILYNRLNDTGLAQAARGEATRTEITTREQEMMRLLREAGEQQAGWVALESMNLPTLKEIRDSLAANEALIEYHMVHRRLHAFVVTREDFHVVPALATADSVRAALKGFHFQLAKFQLDPEYVAARSQDLLTSVRFHLSELHRLLIRPLAQWISGRSLAIVPHGLLHYVPFHALFDGANYLVDNHDIAYAPSASVLRLCRAKPASTSATDLVLAVADAQTPHIAQEVEDLRSLMPAARVFTGEAATADRLREFGPRARRIHIAAHGVFRGDNPSFSSILLGKTWLNLFDIFNLHLGAELTTLSACETGLSAVYEGDELLGLSRGFLYAGTPSLVVSLWRVNDRSTASLMQAFYRRLEAGASKASALRHAILEVRERFPHPYFWAPFLLMGKS